MIIRSQRKGMILNMDCISKIYVDDVVYQDTKSIEYGIVADKEIIGVYSTEEKAVKVLDMIEEAHRSMAFTDGVVFRMPEDEDVEV